MNGTNSPASQLLFNHTLSQTINPVATHATYVWKTVNNAYKEKNLLPTVKHERGPEKLHITQDP